MLKIHLILGTLILPLLALAQPDFFSQSRSIAEAEQKAALGSRVLVTTNRNDIDVGFYRCEWQVDPAVRFIQGKVTIYFTAVKSIDSCVFDLANALVADSAIFHRSSRPFKRAGNNTIEISLGTSLTAGLKDSVSIYYRGTPPANSSAFVTRVQDGSPVMWTLSEPYGAKDWWPCKNNQSDKADSIDILLTFPSKYKSSSNGLLVSQSTTGERTTAFWKHRYPISSYLVAIAVADYRISKDSARVGNRFIPVTNYIYPSFVGSFDQAASTIKIFLERFSSLFGPYPFINESYSQTQFGAGGGMEHQTNSFITSGNEQVAVHELGHQWFGDKVTCASWRDIWLNEGFASYLQYLLLEYNFPDLKFGHITNNRLIITSLPGGSLRVNDTTDFNRIFDFRLSYAKGSWVVHMLRWRLGDSLFYSALRRYLNDPKLSYGIATTADLQRNLEEASGQSFAEFFRDWYEGEGYPSYQLRWSVNRNGWIKLRLGQTSSHPSVPFFEMPVPIRIRSAGKDSLVVLDHRMNGQEYWINTGFMPDTILIDPDAWLLAVGNTVSHDATAADGFNTVKVFPNPASGPLNIQLRNPTGKRLSLRLFNALGQKIYVNTADLNGRDELYTIQMTRFPRGTYWLRIDGDDFSSVKKVVK